MIVTGSDIFQNLQSFKQELNQVDLQKQQKVE